MLPLAIRQKEVGMGEQGRLFERHPLPWVVRLWSTIEPDARREVVTLLAEMARRSLSARGPEARRSRMMNLDEITPAQRARWACVYVRQSSLHQVRQHPESQRRQRELVERAVALGWSPERITVFDQDWARPRPAAASAPASTRWSPRRRWDRSA